MIVMPRPFMYPTCTSLESRSATKPSLPSPRPISSSPTSTASIPASAIAVPGSPPATSSGVIAARISGEIDESGPSTNTREGPNSAYATRHAIVVYRPVDRRQPGQLGIGHALRDQDRREHDAGDEIRPQPRPVVRAGDPYARNPPLETSMLLRDARHRSGPGSAQRDGVGCATLNEPAAPDPPRPRRGGATGACGSPRRSRSASPHRCRSATGCPSAPRCRGSAGGTPAPWRR